MIFASATQFQVYLPCVKECLKCESGSSHFQSGEGPSRGLLRDCETLNFAKVRVQLWTALLVTEMAEECGRGPGKGQRVPATARSSGRKVTAGDKNHRGN